jgi:hypothetical protein
MAFGNTLDLRFLITASSDEAQKAVAELKKRLAGFTDELRDFGRALGLVPSKASTADLALLDKQAGQLANTLGAQLPPQIRGVTSLLSGLSGTTALAVTGAAGLAAGMVALASSTAEYGTEVAKAAKATNLSTDAIQGLGREAESVGGSFESATNAVETFTQKIAAARDGNKGLQTAFRDLGLDLKDFNQTTEQSLDRVLRRLAALPDGLEKSSLASKVFGEEGGRVVLAMKGMEGGVAGLIQRYKDLGLIIDEKGTKEAQKFTKAVQDLQKAWESFKLSIGGPVLEGLNEQLAADRDLINSVKSAWQSLAALVRRDRRDIKEIADIAPPAPPVLPPGLSTDQLRELLLGKPRTEKKSGIASITKDLSDLELQLNRLHRITADAREAFDVQLGAIKEKFRASSGQGEQFFRDIVAAEEEFVRRQLDLITAERKIIQQQATPKNRKTDELEQLAAREARIINESNARIMAADREVQSAALQSMKEREQAEIEHRQRLEQIAELSDNREIERIKGLAEAWQITFEEAERRIGEIRLAALNRRESALTPDIVAGDPKKQQAIEDEFARLAQERALLVEQTTRKIVEARGKDADAVRKLNAELLSLAEAEERAQREREARITAQNAADPSSNLSIFGVDPLGEQTRFGALTSSILGGLGDVKSAFGTFRDFAAGAISQVTAATTHMLSAFILTGKTGGLAFKKLAADIIAALVVQSAVSAIFELAAGLAALAWGLPKQAAEHFASAKLYATVAAIGGAAAAAIGAAGGFGGDSGASANGQFGGNQGGPPPEQVVNRGGGGQQLGVAPEIAVTFTKIGVAIENLDKKISSMRPGDVVTVGSEQASDAIGRAVVSEARRSAEFTNEFGRLMAGPV